MVVFDCGRHLGSSENDERNLGRVPILLMNGGLTNSSGFDCHMNSRWRPFKHKSYGKRLLVGDYKQFNTYNITGLDFTYLSFVQTLLFPDRKLLEQNALNSIFCRPSLLAKVGHTQV